MSYVSPTEGWGAPTEMSGIAAVDRGEVISSRPIMHPRHGNESADIEDPYVPDEFFQEDDDDEGWEALRESSKPPEKRQNYQHKHVPQQQQEQQQMQASSPLCLCGDPCVQLTANTATNPGRKFFKCSKARDDPSSCKYFKWSDELNLMSPGNTNQSFPKQWQHLDAQAKQNFRQIQGKYTPVFDYGAGAGCKAPQAAGTNAFQASDTGALKDRSNDQCFKCGQTGHWSSQCPNQQRAIGFNSSGSGTVQGGNDVCYKCNQLGHWSKDCPNQSVGMSKAGNLLGGGGSNGTCFKCGQPGHWSRDCPNHRATVSLPESEGHGGGFAGAYGGGGMSKAGTCYKCGEAGHWSRDCPNQGGGAGGAKRKFDGGNMGYKGADMYGYGGRANKGGRGANTADSACFKCGQHGHWTRDCPNR